MAADAFPVGGFLLVVLVLLALLVLVLWVLMPFAVFGTKPVLRALLAEQRRTNALLEELRDGGAVSRAGPGRGGAD